MALEAEQGLRINESDHRSEMLGEESEASTRTLALGQNSEAPQDAVPKLQGDTQALQENNRKCELLQQENQQLRKQVAMMGIQLRMEEETSRHLRSQKEDLERELEDMVELTEMEMQPSLSQEAEEKQPEELGEQQKQLSEVQENLLWVREAKAQLTEDNEWLQQEVARLTSWTEQLQVEQEEQLTKIEELQASLQSERENFQIFHNLFYKMTAEQQSKEILLPKLKEQCEWFTLLRKDLEEERRHLSRQIFTLKELIQTLREKHAGTDPENTASLKTSPSVKVEEEDVIRDLDEAQDPAAWIASLKTSPTVKVEEEDVIRDLDEAQDPAAGIGSLKTAPRGKAEGEEAIITNRDGAQDPAPRRKEKGRRRRAFLRFFQRQRQGSKGQARSSPEGASGSPEGTSACSDSLEDSDAHGGLSPKATGQQKSAFWSRTKKDKVKDEPPRARSTLSHIFCFCTR